MKIAVMSDLHLGYKEYRLQERKQDFYDQYNRIIEDILKNEEIKYIIFCGDIFEKPNPPITALDVFENSLKKLKNADKTIIAIRGNHDISNEENFEYPIDIYQNKYNFIILDDDYLVIEDIFIGGITARSPSEKQEFIDVINRLAKLAKDYEKSIVIMHQYIEKPSVDTAHFTFAEIPFGINLYLSGDLHSRRNIKFKNGKKFYYPGSIEIRGIKGVKDYYKHGKGWTVLDTEDFSLEEKSIPLNRENIIKQIDYKNLEEDLENLKNEIYELDTPPLIHVELLNAKHLHYNDIYPLIREELSKKALKTMIRRKGPKTKKKRSITSNHKHITKKINYDNLETELENLKYEIDQEDEKPILTIKLMHEDNINIKEIRPYIKKELSEKTLKTNVKKSFTSNHKRITKNINYENLETELKNLKYEIDQEDEKPIVTIHLILDNKVNIKEIRSHIKKELLGKTLKTRIKTSFTSNHKRIIKNINYNNLETEIENLKYEIEQEDEKPIITIYLTLDDKVNKKETFSFIKKELSGKTLKTMLRTNFTLNRKRINKEINYENLEIEIENLKYEIDQEDEKPILAIKLSNAKNVNRKEVFSVIKKELSEKTLKIRLKIIKE